MVETEQPKVEQLSHEDTEQAVMTVLPSLEVPQLEKLYDLIGLELKAEVKGKKRPLLKGLRRHLDDIEDETKDEWQHYVQILDHLRTKEGKQKMVNVKEEKGEGTSSTTTSSSSASSQSSRTSQDDEVEGSNPSSSRSNSNVVRFRDYKFSGTIGGEKGLSFSSIQFEIRNARFLKYKDAEIRAGVIRAISPTHELRNYFEMNAEATLDDMIEMFRSTFTEQNSKKLFIEFQQERQKDTESAGMFVTRLMTLRRKVRNLSIEEGNEISEETVMAAFHDVLDIGLLNDNLRMELKDRCRGKSLTDNEIMHEISKIMFVEAERKSRLEGEDGNKQPVTTAVAVNAVDAQSKKKDKMNPFVLIEEMKTSHKKDMQEMRSEVNVQLAQIQKTLENNNNRNNNNFNNSNSYGPQNNKNNNNNNNNNTSNMNGNAPSFTPALNQNCPPQQNMMPAPFTYEQFKLSYAGYPENVIQQHWQNFLQSQFRQLAPFQLTGNRRRGPGKCQACQDNNEPRCVHCFKCGGMNHRANQCPEN